MTVLLLHLSMMANPIIDDIAKLEIPHCKRCAEARLERNRERRRQRTSRSRTKAPQADRRVIPSTGCKRSSRVVVVTYGQIRPIPGKMPRRLIRREMRLAKRYLERLCGLRIVLVRNHPNPDVIAQWANVSQAWLPCHQDPTIAMLDRDSVANAPDRRSARIIMRYLIRHEIFGHAVAGLNHDTGCTLPNGKPSIMQGLSSDLRARYCRRSVQLLRAWYGP